MKTAIALVAVMLVAGAAHAVMVDVVVTGEVVWNQVSFGEFAVVNSGDPVTLAFTVDSEDFLNSGTYNTRGYVIDTASFSLTMGAAVAGAQDPFPGVPYFVLRDNDPVADGFFISTDNVDWPTGVPTDEPAQIDPYFVSTCEVGYTGDTLSSLDILDALGTYTYDGLTSFYFNVNDGPFEAIGFDFFQMVISGSSPVEDSSWGRVKALYR